MTRHQRIDAANPVCTDDADVLGAAVRRPPLGRGRQSEAERNDFLVLAAARDVFTTRGAQATVAAVAHRAGVGVGTLYRRYGSKTELIQTLCRLTMEQMIAEAEAALADDADPWGSFAHFVQRCIRLRAGAVSIVAGTIPVTPDMIETSGRASALLQAVVDRARDGGGLRGDVSLVDIQRLIELFGRYPGSFPLDGDPPAELLAEELHARERLVALALDGLRAPAGSLPGPAPTWAEYQRRWIGAFAPQPEAQQQPQSEPEAQPGTQPAQARAESE
ncbi:TetR/AcrR family transcriptional regulator [Streptomycetaceae bacterium NBC_01309]